MLILGGGAVLERDSSYQNASAVLSAGGMRQQFSVLENVRMSLYGLEFMRQMQTWPGADDLHFVANGYVFLTGSDVGASNLRLNHKVQTGAGADVALLQPNELKALFPWMETGDIKLASFVRSGEGWFDPWTLLNNMRRRAGAGGVEFLRGATCPCAAPPALSATVKSRMKAAARPSIRRPTHSCLRQAHGQPNHGPTGVAGSVDLVM